YPGRLLHQRTGVLHPRYSWFMKTISQRELRNDSGQVMREVQRGASFRVTSRGVPVARLTPLLEDSLAELTLREGTGVMEFPPGLLRTETTGEALAELRGER